MHPHFFDAGFVRMGTADGIREILLERVDVHLPRLQVRALAVHRHLPETAAVAPHRHTWAQALVYLSGRGRQDVAGVLHPVEPGTLVAVPPGVPHAFRRARGVAPLCLIVDFDWDGAAGQSPVVRRLPAPELRRRRRELDELLRWQAREPAVLQLEAAALLLRLVSAVLRSAGWLEGAPPPEPTQLVQQIRRLVAEAEADVPVGELARRSGYQRDHLNRLLLRDCGRTLGRIRDEHRLALARRLLGAGLPVGQVAAEIGLPDTSYFARWFRRWEGRAPSEMPGQPRRSQNRSEISLERRPTPPHKSGVS